MAWSASVTSGSSWLSISSGSSGSNSGTIICNYTANTTTSSRTATIMVTASGATGSPKDIIVTQACCVSVSVTDSDNDGVIDQWDNCTDTPPNAFTNKQGCSETQLGETSNGCAILESNLSITMPCIDIFGTTLPIKLERFNNKTDPFGYYWKLNLQ